MKFYKKVTSIILYIFYILILAHCGPSLAQEKSDETNSFQSILSPERVPQCQTFVNLSNSKSKMHKRFGSVRDFNDLGLPYVWLGEASTPTDELQSILHNALNHSSCHINDVDNSMGDHVRKTFSIKHNISYFSKSGLKYKMLYSLCLINESSNVTTPIGFTLEEKGLSKIGDHTLLTSDSEMGFEGFIDYKKPVYNICFESNLKKYLWLGKKGSNTKMKYEYFPNYVKSSSKVHLTDQGIDQFFYDENPLDQYLDVKAYPVSGFSKKEEDFLKKHGYKRIHSDSSTGSKTYTLSGKTHFGYGYYFECSRQLCMRYDDKQEQFYNTSNVSFEDIKSMSAEDIKFLGRNLKGGVLTKSNKEGTASDVIGIGGLIFTPYFINAKNWNLEELTPEQLSSLILTLNIFEKAERKSNFKVHDISTDSIKNLSLEHVLKAEYNLSELFSPHQIQALSKEAIKGVDMRFIRPEHIQLLGLNQLEALLSASKKDLYSTKARREWIKEQVQAIPIQMISQLSTLYYASFYSKEQIEAITPAQIKKIKTEFMI